MSFAVLDAHPNIYTQCLHLFAFGCVNSMQFTAMNTLTLKDLSKAQSANGNSLLSMVINVCMSMGVALVGVLLHLFEKIGAGQSTLWSFQQTFIILGAITILASLVFRQLRQFRLQDQNHPVS